MNVDKEDGVVLPRQFVDLISETMGIKTHKDFLSWARSSLQEFLPHDLMIAAWGDFTLGIIYYEFFSLIPGARADFIQDQQMAAFLKHLYSYWLSNDRTPFQLLGERSVIGCCDIQDQKLKAIILNKQSAVLHGIKDVRGGSDSFYVLLSANPDIPKNHSKSFHQILPYIDATLRQIELLPDHTPAQQTNDTKIQEADLNLEDAMKLSDRESQIMGWVCSGKTNVEIGLILDISSFTVKNHLQHIFKKLDVVNRSQAVAKMRNQISSNQ